LSLNSTIPSNLNSNSNSKSKSQSKLSKQTNKSNRKNISPDKKLEKQENEVITLNNPTNDKNNK